MPRETERSVRKPAAPGSRRSRAIDGLKVRILDDPAASGAELGRALRMLARMMVRGHRDAGEHAAISHEAQSGSDLTVLPTLAPHHDTNEAA